MPFLLRLTQAYMLTFWNCLLASFYLTKLCSVPLSFLIFSVSKQHSVVPSQIFELEDGTSSYKDFAMSKNNRFTSAGQASKNIIQPPSCVLHYYNVPLCVTEETFTKVGTRIWELCRLLLFPVLKYIIF